MSTYVLSDIHGQYIAYEKMLKKIGFGKDDYLYVLGDVIDRGPDGIHIIQDIMKRDNVELLLGNHEYMLLNAIQFLKNKDKDEEESKKNYDGLTPFELWVHPCNGGEGTCLEFLGLPEKVQKELLDFLRQQYLIRRVKIGKTTYHLSHSYSSKKKFGEGIKVKNLSHERAEEIVWESIFDKPADAIPSEKLFAYSRDVYVVGHIFTQRLGHMDEYGKGMIYRSDNYRGYKVIDVDCGMALNSRSSRLGCLCLETQEEFYVPLLED